MQTWGTGLQLAGAVITLGGLLWAWHKITGIVTRCGAAARNLPTQLRESMAGLFTEPPATAEASVNIEMALSLVMEAQVAQGGTPDERLMRLENQINALNNQLAQQESRLRAEMDRAIADAVQESQELSNALRLRDIGWAAGGIVFTIIGLVCQLNLPTLIWQSF